MRSYLTADEKEYLTCWAKRQIKTQKRADEIAAYHRQGGGHYEMIMAYPCPYDPNHFHVGHDNGKGVKDGLDSGVPDNSR
jgi:hypothetical protein